MLNIQCSTDLRNLNHKVRLYARVNAYPTLNNHPLINSCSFYVEIDRCRPNPCFHGGRCEQSENGYFCKCLAQYQGRNCEGMYRKCAPGIYEISVNEEPI